ncbi:hypothetical protein CSB11_00065 [Candidatus Campbellbacteria bacterium]|nr:MAG: hypothetical protein CSB11_00065 [Candidatus Campbellbacteria bacterium]
MDLAGLDIIKVLIPWVVSFLFGLFITPVVLSYLYKHKVWRRNDDKKEVMLDDKNGEISEIINKTKKDKITPRMGGIVIVFSVLFTVFIFWIVSFGIFGNPSGKIDFLSRSQTWLPLSAFAAGALMGLLDDILTIKNIKIGKFIGLPLKFRIIFVLIIALLIGFWFYSKLGYSQVFIPFYGYYELSYLFVPFFVTVFLATFATSNIDGLDGLAGGVMASVYSAFGFIAFYKQLFDISAFCFVVVGGILAFLWFNISPARFYMTEVGYNALSFALVVIAFATDTVFLLPIVAVMLYLTLASTVLQVFSIRVFKRRIFKVAPLHHHFEKSGWSETQIVFRYWIVSFISGILGVCLAVVSIRI